MLHFFMFTRISNVDAKPDLSLLSVKNHRSRLEPIYLIYLYLLSRSRLNDKINPAEYCEYFLITILTFALGAQKNRLIETVIRVHVPTSFAVTYIRIRHWAEVKDIEFDKKD